MACPGIVACPSIHCPSFLEDSQSRILQQVLVLIPLQGKLGATGFKPVPIRLDLVLHPATAQEKPRKQQE